jgi:hypothetical protein
MKHKIVLHVNYSDTSKLGVAGEELYAELISENTARVVTIPFSNRICNWGDIVEFEGDEIKKVLETTHKVHYFSFQGPEDLFGVLENYFQKHDICGEVLVGNFFGIAVPIDMTDDEFSNIIENTPVPLNTRIKNE